VADNLDARIDRLETAMERAFVAIDALADKEAKLDDVLVLLTEAQIKTEERFQETDVRIDKLVSAIGEFIRVSGNR
jgi:galactokinase